VAFPGRLDEKKKRNWGVWVAVVAVVLLCAWIVSAVKKAINEPVPAPPKKQQSIVIDDEKPGLVTRKADAFTDDVGQIRKGNIRKRAPKRVYRSGSAVEYSADPASDRAPSDYYSGR